MDAFVDSFGDCALCKQVLQQNPVMLAEALTWAIRIEAIDDSGTPDAGVTSPGIAGTKTPAHVAAVEGVFAAKGAPTKVPPHDVDVRQLAAKLGACKTELIQLKQAQLEAAGQPRPIETASTGHLPAPSAARGHSYSCPSDRQSS